jgi:hypothetical protein
MSNRRESGDFSPTVDIDPTQPNGRGRCPACGLQFLAGHRLSDPRAASLWHELPECERYAGIVRTEGPLAFIRWAKAHGAELVPIEDTPPAA